MAAKKNLMVAPFVASADAAAFDKFKLPPAGTHFLVVKDGTYKPYPIADFATTERVLRWVDDHKYPLLIKVDADNAPGLFAQEKFIALLFLDPRKTEESTATMERLRKVIAAQKELPDVLFGWLDAVEWSDYAAGMFGVSSAKIPASVVVHPDGDEYFPVMSDGVVIGVDPSRIIVAIQEARADKIPRYHVKGTVGGLFKSVSSFVTGHPYWTFIIVVLVLLAVVFGCGLLADAERSHYQQLGKYD